MLAHTTSRTCWRLTQFLQLSHTYTSLPLSSHLFCCRPTEHSWLPTRSRWCPIHQQEKEPKLAKALISFLEVICCVLDDLTPHTLCDYAYDLCTTTFTEFYNNCYCINKWPGKRFTVNMSQILLYEATAAVLTSSPWYLIPHTVIPHFIQYHILCTCNSCVCTHLWHAVYVYVWVRTKGQWYCQILGQREIASWFVQITQFWELVNVQEVMQTRRVPLAVKQHLVHHSKHYSWTYTSAHTQKHSLHTARWMKKCQAQTTVSEDSIQPLQGTVEVDWKQCL